MSNELNKNNSVIGRANQAINEEEAQSRNKKSETAIMLGLALSSLFTIIYMVVALGGSLLTIWQSPIAAYAVGVLLGIAAVAPGEVSVWTWKTKLQSDRNINGTQVTVAWVAGIVAAISAGVSTISFFAYLLQGLMPNWYNTNVAAGINVINIALSWVVFGIAVFVYAASGDEATRNRERAKAAGLLQKAENDMIKGIAGAIQARINDTVDNLDAADEFYDDAMENIARMMGLSGERLERMRRSGRGQQQGALPSHTQRMTQSVATPPKSDVTAMGAVGAVLRRAQGQAGAMELQPRSNDYRYHLSVDGNYVAQSNSLADMQERAAQYHGNIHIYDTQAVEPPSHETAVHQNGNGNNRVPFE